MLLVASHVVSTEETRNEETRNNEPIQPIPKNADFNCSGLKSHMASASPGSKVS